MPANNPANGHHKKDVQVINGSFPAKNLGKNGRMMEQKANTIITIFLQLIQPPPISSKMWVRGVY